MSGDMSSLKSGQQLSGISIPRKIEDKPAISASLPKPVTQSSPQPNTPWAKIEMGQLEKSAVLNTQSTKPQLPIQNQTISTPLPAVIIPEKKTGINRTILFASIAGLAIVIAVAYWFFALRSTDPVVLETPTPTPVVLETPTPKLDSLISGQVLNVQLPVSGDPLATFKINAQSSVIAAGKLQTVQPTIEDGGIVIQLKPDILLDRFLVAYPASMKAVFAGPDSYIYYFGQREIFDKKGLIVAGEPISSRLVIVSEVQDATSTLVSMKAWETTMSADLNLLFELSYKKGVGAVFQDNTYKGNSIRYINFLWPDKSIDYAIVRASNGKQYLVISNSRESMYATVDKLSVSQR